MRHPINAWREADLIVGLQRGEIVETGSFAELIRARDPFVSLYRLQFRIYDEE